MKMMILTFSVVLKVTDSFFFLTDQHVRDLFPKLVNLSQCQWKVGTTVQCAWLHVYMFYIVTERGSSRRPRILSRIMI